MELEFACQLIGFWNVQNGRISYIAVFMDNYNNWGNILLWFKRCDL